MTKNDLAKAVAGKTGLSQTQAADALGAVLESVPDSQLTGDTVLRTAIQC